MRRASWSPGYLSHIAVLTMSVAASVLASGAHASVVGSLSAGFEVFPPRRPLMLVQNQKQIAELKVGDVDGAPGRPIPLNIQVLNAASTDELFIMTGIPEGFTLDPGGYLGKFWAVNSKVMPALTLTAPQNYSGSFTVSIVRRRDGAPSTASASFKVTIRNPVAAVPAPAPAVAAATATVPPSPQPERPKAVRKANPNEAAYMARGKALFDAGDISAARAVFENLALQGSAAGAMALGETYDPLALRARMVKGLEADIEKARMWYLKAEELGGLDARKLLNELAGR